MKKNKSFSEFVSKHSDVVESAKFDPEKEIDEWINYLDQLYRTIEGFVSPYGDEGAVQLVFAPISIMEESLGTYVVNSARLLVGNAKFIFNPIGTMLIGSKGRVDLIGPTGRAMLALVRGNGPRISVKVTIDDGSKQVVTDSKSREEALEKLEPWEWKIVSNRPPYKYTELNADKFLNLLMSLAQ
ncbi:hypothetical protein [Pseudomonas sp. MWU318]|uniref:hypothetical protein n=1 Tax=Pseudomonas sp. MWU318 TaxID=2802569 RepID=UPI0019272CA8|nr:hypothetical protein [Pseudomonas sp. MWU318]